MADAKPSKLTSSYAANTLGPSILAAVAMLGLVFGGCCSNVTASRPPLRLPILILFLLGICVRVDNQVSMLVKPFDTKR